MVLSKKLPIPLVVLEAGGIRFEEIRHFVELRINFH
jgi:hypothetical protein